MMDWYSNYPAPSKEEAIKEVMSEMREYEIEKYEKIVKEEIMGLESLGSYTGWYVLIKSDVKEKVKKRIEEIEREIKGVEYVLRRKVDENFTYENR